MLIRLEEEVYVVMVMCSPLLSTNEKEKKEEREEKERDGKER